MLHKLQTIEKDLQDYYQEKNGESFSQYDSNKDMQTYDYGDYIGLAIDGINDLIGVIEKEQG